ncbi:MAG: hypothetical protein R2764_16340 [Bacteroidales bacterium]
MAIYATNDGTNNNTFYVNRAIFNDNTWGISMNSVKNATVLFSEFNVAKNLADAEECEGVDQKASGYGIDMTGCTGFAIEENEFTPGSAGGTYTGIRVNKTEAADEIYKNYFNGLTYGNYAVGKNWDGNNTAKGLAYYCNENTANWQDFYVDTIPGAPSGIQDPIGKVQLPAGNTFSPTAFMHINNKGNYWIGYYYYAPTAGDTNTAFYPNTDKIWKVTREEVYQYENECLSHYGGGGSGGGTERSVVLNPGEMQEAEQEYFENLNSYNDVKALYDYLKDGGNTELTISGIETAFPDQM